MKNTPSFTLYFKFWGYFLKKKEDTATRSFISCCFILAFTLADIIFHKFLELHSTLSKKRFSSQFFFFNIFTQSHPLVGWSARCQLPWKIAKNGKKIIWCYNRKLGNNSMWNDLHIKTTTFKCFFMYRSALYDLYNLRYYLKQYAGSRIFHPRHYR